MKDNNRQSNGEQDLENDQIFNSLRSYLYRWDCPSESELGDYFLNILSEGQSSQIKDHMIICQSCTRELNLLHEFLENTKFEDDESQIKRNKMYFQKSFYNANLANSSLRGELEKIKQFTIVLDDGKELEVLIELRESSAGLNVFGQIDLIESVDEEMFIGATVNIFSDDLTRFETIIDELGFFTSPISIGLPFVIIIKTNFEQTISWKVDLQQPKT